MTRIFDVNRRVLNVRMPCEIGADEGAIKRPIVFGVGRRVHADKAAAATNEPLERGFLRRIQYIARGRQKHDDLVLRERFVTKRGGVFRRIDRKSTRASLLSNGVNARWNRIVPKACGFRKDEDRERGTDR